MIETELALPATLRHYTRVRAQTIELCAPLTAEDCSVQPHPDVSPPKWHLGHSTWFFETFLLMPMLEGYRPFDERLHYFFNSYYESQGPRISRSQRGNMTRPGLDRVLDYRAYVDEGMATLLEQDNHEAERLTRLGLNHEQQHQELLVYDLKYILGHNPLFPPYSRSAPSTKAKEAPHHRYLPIPAGRYPIGHAGDGFCWDNELSRHEVLLQDFGIGSRLITAGEYLAFLRDGGYERFELWQSDGIAWARDQDVKAPMYWYPADGDDWKVYTLDKGIAPLDPARPVTHLNWYEADAYARWADARLPTEFEWEAAYRHLGKTEGGNWLESGILHPGRARDANDHQMMGHAWEWTNSAYLPYPRYPRPEGALGEYNGKFMINQMVLRGGSCATPRSHIRPTYRNFFQPDKRWMLTGLRLAKDL